MSPRIWLSSLSSSSSSSPPLLSSPLSFPHHLSPHPTRRRQRHLLLSRLTYHHHNHAECSTTATTSSSSSSSSCSGPGGKTEEERVPMTTATGGGGGRRWWGKVVSQRVNAAGLAFFLLKVAATREGRRLSLPHVSVPDIRWVDWGMLERLGFRGVVFDKDNTLTAPYSLSLWPPLSPSLACCQSAFPGRVTVFSNSAGLHQYDPDGSEAKALEDSIGGIHVIRHETKKPVGTAEDIEKYFGCSASHLIMVGDRHFTDVVYGNQHGFLTILTEPLSLSEEPFIVQQVRKLERYLVDCWYKKGLKPINHRLLLECKQCVKVPSL